MGKLTTYYLGWSSIPDTNSPGLGGYNQIMEKFLGGSRLEIAFFVGDTFCGIVDSLKKMNKVSCVDMILLCETVEISWNLEILNHDECWYYHDALLPVVFLHVGWHFFKDLFRHQKHHHSIKKMKNTKTLMVVPFWLLFTLQETRELYQAPMTLFLGGAK